MWNPFRAARQRRADEERQRTAEREAFMQVLATIADSFAEAQRASHDAVAELAKASAAQAATLQDHLALFRVTSLPTSRVLRDEDEYQREMERLGLDTADQLRYVLAQTADPEN